MAYIYFQDKRSFGSNHSGTNSPHISLYVDKEVLEDPWADLEKKQSPFQSPNFIRNDSESKQNSTDPVESDDEVLSGDNDDDTWYSSLFFVLTTHLFMYNMSYVCYAVFSLNTVFKSQP